MVAELEPAGWRREVGELYAAVREEPDPERGHLLWRTGRDRLFRDHPQSPLPAGDPLRRSGLPYWPYDADLGGSPGTLILDLNFLYHPFCRYDDAWQCPLAPPGNTISAPVPAGERLAT